MVHCNTFVPRPTAVKLVVGLLIFPIVALPEITDQVPTPLVGVLAANVVVGFKTHKVWFGPANAMLGAGSTVIVIVELVNGQAPPFVILHCKIFVPNNNPETVVVGLFTLLNVPEPEITDQVPVPLVGVFAANVALGVNIQTV